MSDARFMLVHEVSGDQGLGLLGVAAGEGIPGRLDLGEGFGCGGGSTLRLLRRASHTGADFVISRSEPMIDNCTSRSEKMRE